MRCTRSILRNGRIDFIRPGQDAALEIPDFAKARLPQELHGIGGTLAAAAMGHDFAGAIELSGALGQFAERDEVAVQIANLVLVRLANVENKKIVSAIEPCLQLAGRNFGNTCGHGNMLLSSNSAKLFVVDQLMDRTMVAANRARRILAQPQFAEAHSQRVKEQEPADQRFADAEDQLDRLHGLNRADDAGQNAQHAAFGARRHQARRRRFGIEAAVARPPGIAEDGGLAFKPEDRAVDIGLAQQHAGVVDQIARREIVGAVDDDVVIAEQVEGVLAGQARLVGVDANRRDSAGQTFFGGLNLGPAHVGGGKRNLALQIGEVDDVEIDDSQPPHAGRGQIKPQRRAQSARADHQDFGLGELELPLHAHFGHDQVAAVALNLFFRQCALGIGNDGVPVTIAITNLLRVIDSDSDSAFGFSLLCPRRRRSRARC